MKKALTTIVALCLAAPLALGACSSNPQEAATDATETTTADTSADAKANEKTDQKTDAKTDQKGGVNTDVSTVDAKGTEANTTEKTDTKTDTKTDAKTDAKTDEKKDTQTKESSTGNSTDLPNWGIKLVYPEGAEGVYKGEYDEFYIFTKEVEKPPYILACVYNMDRTGEDFLNEYTEKKMKVNHEDLKIAQKPTAVKIGDKDCTKIVYTYTLKNGHEAKDTCVVAPANGRVYLFDTIEVEDLGYSVGDTFEQVIKDSVIYKSK